MSDLRTLARDIESQCLFTRLRRLDRLLARVYDDELRPLGIRATQHGILVALAGHGPLRAVHLVSALDLEKSTVSRNVALLQDQGWVTVDDERRLRVTPAGSEILERAVPAWERAQARAAELLGASEIPIVER